MRHSGPWLAVIGVALMAAGGMTYSYALVSVSVPTPGEVSYLTELAQVYLVALFVGVAVVLVGLSRAVAQRALRVQSMGQSPLSPGWILPYLLSLRMYRRYFVASAIIYGLFYAVITSMLVYQPSVDFSQAYAAPIPSGTVTPVPAALLSTPVLTLYLTNHVGLLLIPLTFLLDVTISILVGLNFALAAFAFESRVRGAGRGWVGGVGALVGLFTGCPTCAGLFFANVLGGTGAVSFATILGYYQPVFVVLSLPVLAATPYLISRSLARVYREGCVVLPKKASALGGSEREA